MTEPTPPEVTPEVPADERWLARLTDPEHLPHLTRALSLLPARELDACYRLYFRAGDEARSFALVRVPLHKVTGAAVLAALPRLHAQRPDLTKLLARRFLQQFADALKALQEGHSPEQLDPEALPVLCWVLEEELSPEDQMRGWTDLLAAFHGAKSDLHAEQVAHQASRQQVEQAGRQADRLRDQLTRAEEQTQERLSALERRHTQLLEAEGRRHDLRLLREQQAHERTRLALGERVAELEAERARREAEAHVLEFTRVQDLRAQLVRERNDAEQRRTQLHRQLREGYEHIHQLTLELEALREQPPTPTFDAGQLGDALILHYEQCGQTSVDRLLGLFTAYRAFLGGHPEEGLSRASNLAALGGREPSGILLLGLERLLEDGANLPLERYLRSRVFQQEARLHELIEQVASPRLEVPS